MKKSVLSVVGLLLIALILAGVNLPAGAAPVFQTTPLPTPTAGPDGRILYTVQEGESVWLIAAKFGIEINEIYALNNLNPEQPVVQPGQVLLLGLGGPSEPTSAAPSPQATSAEPTPTQGPGTGDICVMLFADANGDSLRQEEEVSIPEGAVSVSERSGKYSQTDTTTEDPDPLTEEIEPLCFEDLPEGDYNISLAIPEGYNPTTVLNKAVELTAGDEITLNFGAQLSTQARLASPPPEEGGRSPLLGVLGIALLLAGVGLGIFSVRLGRGGTRFRRES